jgi:hypothetical protein
MMWVAGAYGKKQTCYELASCAFLLAAHVPSTSQQKGLSPETKVGATLDGSPLGIGNRTGKVAP